MSQDIISTYQPSTANSKATHAVKIGGIQYNGKKLAGGIYPLVREDGDRIVIKHPKHGAIRVPVTHAKLIRKRATKAVMAARRADPAYQASLLKPKRPRATKDQMASRRAALLAIVEEQKPMTVRQVYYQMEVRGVIEKTEDGYAKIQKELAEMRRDGALPYGWIVDNTRMQRKPQSFCGIIDAITHSADHYRKDIWEESHEYVEIWLEKDALAGVILPVSSLYDVPLMVARGYASLSFLHSAAENITAIGKPTYIYHLGDFDPSGVNAGEKIEKTLRELAPGVDIYFKRLAVTEDQIRDWNLPTRPTKVKDPRSKGFGDISVELDAIPPKGLRWLVREALRRHVSDEDLAEFRADEAREKAELKYWAAHIKRLAEEYE